MDKRIRRNEICVIGLPRCDFVFSSTRSCFIAYGFEESKLEMTIIRNILEKKGIQAIEAGGHTTPGQNAYCAKICSKIIAAQFCIVLLNNDMRDNQESPNANVNMEYGLMLGFNKYVIPFQRESQKLPFNVAGLDTIKYTNNNLEEQATKVIEQAISITQQEDAPSVVSDQQINSFLLKRNLLMSPVDNEGERNLFRLGEPVSFNMLVDFSGMVYTYLGQFAALRSEIVIWRIVKLVEILEGRKKSLAKRMVISGANKEHIYGALHFFNTVKIMIIVTSKKEQVHLENKINPLELNYAVEIVSMEQIEKELAEYMYEKSTT